MYLIDLLSLV